MSRDVTAAISYFGKVPSRGDFVRASDNHQLLGWLDRWAGQGVELLSQNPDWKRVYDQAPGVHYAFLGSRSRTVLSGHLHPSHDVSQRRFPLLSAVRLDVSDPVAFIGRAPLAMSKVWAGLSRLAEQAVTDADATAALAEMTEARFVLCPDAQAYNATFKDFLDMQTLSSLEGLLHAAGHADVRLRQTLPALGLLLQPILAGGNVSVDKALAFPLPVDVLYRPLVAAFWLDIVSCFVGRADIELAALIRDDAVPSLLVGFNGADPHTLRAALDPRAAGDFLIDVQAADWVDDYLRTDYHLNNFASYLERGKLALGTARKLFGETFLGT